MPNKFAYTKRGQVKFTSPKKIAPNKLAYNKPGQVKFKPKPTIQPKPRFTEVSLLDLVEAVMYKKTIDQLTVVNPKTKKRIKAKTALGYKHDHPAYLAVMALLKKKGVTVPTPDVEKLKPGEQGSLFMQEPFEVGKTSIESKIERAVQGGELVDLMESHFADITFDFGEREAMEQYTGSGFSYINKYLRGDDSGAYDDAIESGMVEVERDEDEEIDYDAAYEQAESIINNYINGLDEAFEREGTAIPEDVITWRGVRGADVVDEFIQAGEGATYTDMGFISTSMDMDVARGFAGVPKPGGEMLRDAHEMAIIQVLNPKGSRVLYPMSDSIGISDEKEIILKRKQQFKIEKIIPMKTHTLIQVIAILEGQK